MTGRLKILFLFCLILSNAGCAGVPFKKIEYVSLDNANPQKMLQEFKAVLAPEIRVINSIVFQYKWQQFSALGYSRIGLADEQFQVSCMNPVGIKLFELTGNREEIKPVFVLKELLQRGDLPRAVGEDIRRIYFDILPGPDAQISKQKFRVIFSQPMGKGTVKYVFAGSRHWLVEKHYYERNRLLWSVYYYDYLSRNGQLYPAELILRHRRFGYNLIIRLKEVLN
jgi:hypothetical protein